MELAERVTVLYSLLRAWFGNVELLGIAREGV